MRLDLRDMTPEQATHFIEHAGDMLAPTATPLLDAFPREPAKGIIHVWPPLCLGCGQPHGVADIHAFDHAWEPEE